MEIVLSEVIGLIGAGLYVLSYALLQYRRRFARSIWYSFLNFMAALLVLYSTLYYWNASSFVIQVFWICISCFGMMKCILLANKRQKRKMIMSQRPLTKSI